MTIFNTLKTNLELVNITLLDDKLLNLANSHIAHLMNNGIPVSLITQDTEFSEFNELREHDRMIVVDFIVNNILIDLNYDMLSNTSYSILQERITMLIFQLKVVYSS